MVKWLILVKIKIWSNLSPLGQSSDCLILKSQYLRFFQFFQRVTFPQFPSIYKGQPSKQSKIQILSWWPQLCICPCICPCISRSLRPLKKCEKWKVAPKWRKNCMINRKFEKCSLAARFQIPLSTQKSTFVFQCCEKSRARFGSMGLFGSSAVLVFWAKIMGERIPNIEKWIKFDIFLPIGGFPKFSILHFSHDIIKI